MVRVLCDNPSCEYYKKVKKEGICIAEEIQVSNEGLCLSATDFTSIEEDLDSLAEGER